MNPLYSSDIQAWIRGNENHLNKKEDELMLKYFPQFQSKNRYGHIGEFLFELYLQSRNISYSKKPNYEGLEPDFETDNYFYEIKTRRYNMSGTAGEKIPAVPFKYRNLSIIKPTIIVLIAYQEVEMSILFKPDERASEFIDFFKSKGFEYQAFSSLITSLVSNESSISSAESLTDNMSTQIDSRFDFKPFLKWIGGKSRLLPYLDVEISKIESSKYIEPFLGGGASLLNALKYNFDEYIACDINRELIDLWITVRDNVEDLILELSLYEHMNTKEDYLAVRRDFNDKIRAGNDIRDEVEIISISAMFIYLNHTCFRGLYRVNKRNEFNVPYGNYKKYSIDYDNLRAVSRAIQNVKFEHHDYRETIELYANEDSFIYLDPPYYETGKAYASDDFDSNEFKKTLDSLACNFIASNSIDFVELLDELYRCSPTLTPATSAMLSCQPSADFGANEEKLYQVSEINVKESMHRSNPGEERIEILITKK